MTRRSGPPCAGAHQAPADKVSRSPGLRPCGWQSETGAGGVGRLDEMSNLAFASRLAIARFRLPRDSRTLIRPSLGVLVLVVLHPRTFQIGLGGADDEPQSARTAAVPVLAFGGIELDEA